MKMFRRRLKGNNKGFSLIELLCAVTIFGLTTTVIGGAMVVSSQSYQRGAIELDVQKEAQTTTNLLTNLVVDAVNVTFNNATSEMTVTEKDGTEFKVRRDSDGNLLYTEGAESAVVLAEGVTYFKVDASDFTTTKNVEIDVAMKRGEKEYQASSNTTARNGQMNPSGDMDARIFIENTVTLEPGQSYYFDALVSSSVDFEGLTWEFVGTPEAQFITQSDAGATVKLNANASGQICFTVKTNKNKEVTDPSGAVVNVPLDIQTVTINVRRVTGFTGVNDVVISGDGYQNGAVYRVYAQLDGDYLDKQIGTAYDSDYKNPYYVDFNIKSTTGITSSDISIESGVDAENRDIPYYQIKLNKDMNVGDKIEIECTAKHPEGQITGETYTVGSETKPILYNKASTNDSAYDYDTVTYTHVIEKTADAFSGTSGLKRGDNQYDIFYNASYGTIAYSKLNLVSEANKYRKYMRIWKKTDAPPATDYEGWVLVDTTGTLDIKLEKKWSLLFDAADDYYVEFMCVVSSTDVPTPTTVYWPEMNPDGTVNTPRDMYISRYTIEAASFQFMCPALNCHTYTDHIGTYDSPETADRLTGYTVNIKTSRINFKNLNEKYKFEAEYLKDDRGDNDPSNDLWKGIYCEASKSFRDDMEDMGSLTFKCQSTDVIGKKVRIKCYVNYPKSTYDFATNTFIINETRMNLYDLNTGEGVIYLQY